MNINKQEFIDLVNIEDEFDKSIKEAQLRKKYSEMDIDDKQFNKILDSCKKKYNKKIFFDNKIILPKK